MNFDKFIGHRKAFSIASKILSYNIRGRTIIFYGEKGVGKFTLALMLAEKILGQIPFSSRDFLFYRNDDFLLKTLFFLKFLGNDQSDEKFVDYIRYLLSRSILALELGEVSNFKLKGIGEKEGFVSLDEFLANMQSIIESGKILEILRNSNSIKEGLKKISDEISQKRTIPLDFMRKAIQFDSIRSSTGRKVIVIGDFENATIEAQNSALKLFEEPSEETLIILTVSRIENVLPTILSRSIIIRFGKLGENELRGIFPFAGDGINCCENTIELMKEALYSYSGLAKDKLNFFFKKVALEINRSEILFDFVEEINGIGGDFVICFLKEVLNFLRHLHFKRQMILRGVSLFEAMEYQDILKELAPFTVVSEIHNMGREVLHTIEKIEQEKFSCVFFLIDLLIKIARWYKKVLLRSQTKEPVMIR